MRTIKSRQDFERVFTQGRRFNHPNIRMVISDCISKATPDGSPSSQLSASGVLRCAIARSACSGRRPALWVCLLPAGTSFCSRPPRRHRPPARNARCPGAPVCASRYRAYACCVICRTYPDASLSGRCVFINAPCRRCFRLHASIRPAARST